MADQAVGKDVAGKDGTQEAVVEIDGTDAPAFCPHPKMTLWSQHPRVFLDLSVTGEAKCPYCGTRYRLKPGSRIHRH
jgi:uncharacterized Zn-finger protein